jgi:hypothetical protein
MPLSLYIAEDGQKRMIEKTAKNVATSRATTLRTDRYYLGLLLLFSTVKNLFTHVFHLCRVMASIKDSSNEAQRKDEPQEVYCVVYFTSAHFTLCYRCDLDGGGACILYFAGLKFGFVGYIF